MQEIAPQTRWGMFENGRGTSSLMIGENMESKKGRMLQQQVEQARKRGGYHFSWMPSH